MTATKNVKLPGGLTYAADTKTRYVLVGVTTIPKNPGLVKVGAWKWNDDEATLHTWRKKWGWRRGTELYVVDTKTGRVRP